MFISGIHGSFATKWKHQQNCSEKEGLVPLGKEMQPYGSYSLTKMEFCSFILT